MTPGKRRQASKPVGLGYMPKGGAAAAKVHNEHWRAALDGPTPDVPEAAEPVGAPVRASARGFWRGHRIAASPWLLVLGASVIGDALLWWSR